MHVTDTTPVTDTSRVGVQSETASVQQSNVPEPIAIIGASCRLPGEAHDLQKFWELLKARRSAWSEFPMNRFNPNGFYSKDGGAKLGTITTAGGHFIQQDVAAFDIAFFGMHPNEVMALDPQQRLLLQIAYESFENAGFSLDDLSNSNTGVYVGQWTSDYHDMLTRDQSNTPAYLPVGTGSAIASNRISYIYNLHGPSFTVDTGCSASLVALHQAVTGLRAGDAEQSFVAGVNLTLDPHRFAYLSKVSMFSKEGKSFPFDGRANGYGRGEACSGVLLQPLSLALKQGRPIRAVIRNTTCNQDGKTSGITVPSSSAQQAAIEKAYADVQLEPWADYVEAHGTGTRVGDPIEAKAISSALGVTRTPDTPLPIGSVKGNIGHAESAAGVTGLVKAMLMLEHGEIPAQVNSDEPNPLIPTKKLKLRVPLAPEKCVLNRISVNSFGYGGTNAHVILDSVATISEVDYARAGLIKGVNGALNGNGINGHGINGHAVNGNGVNGHTKNGHSTNGNVVNGHFVNGNEANSHSTVSKQRLFLLSAATQTSCQTMALNLANHLEAKAKSSNSDSFLNDVAYALSRRSVLEFRLGLISSSVDDLIAQLRLAASESVPSFDGRGSQNIAFVFSGQGAQYPRMARELLESWPVFADSLERAGECVLKCGGAWKLIEEISKPSEVSRVAEPEVAQPLTTAVQIALVDALYDIGIKPSAVAGHSSGEIAAAYAAGIVSFDDAMAISYHRGRLSSALVQKSAGNLGAMLAVGASPDAVDEVIADLAGDQSRVRIACYNSPSSVTVSGDEDAIDKLRGKLDEQKTFNRKLRTGGVAYHSHQMKLIGEEYGAALANIKALPGDASVTMISSVTGEDIRNTTVDGNYWVNNMLSPVRFTEAVTKISQTKAKANKVGLILELGPHFQLVGPVKQTLRSLGSAASKIQCTGTLKRGEDAEVQMLDMLRFLWLERCPANIPRVNSSFSKLPALINDLPPYPFDLSKRYWAEPRESKLYRQRKFLPHELVGVMGYEHNPAEPRWRLSLRVDDVPWLKGHKVQGDTVFPATGYIAMAIQAAQQNILNKNSAAVIKQFRFRNISVEKALVLASGKENLELFIALRPQSYSAKRSSDVWSEFRVFSVSGDEAWSEHCHGLIHAALEGDREISTINNLSEFAQSGQIVNPKKFYYSVRDLGLDWSDPFDGLADLQLSDDGAVGTVSPSPVENLIDGPQGPLYVIHPATLDTILFHTLASIILLGDKADTPFVPTFIKNLHITVPKEGRLTRDVTCYVKKARDGNAFDLSAVEAGSRDSLLVYGRGLSITRLPSLSASADSQDFSHTFDQVAYIPKLTDEWIERVCRAEVPTKSVSYQFRTYNALALSYIKTALGAISRDEIPEEFLRHWYDWMLIQTKTDFSEEDVLATANDESIPARMLRRIGPHFDKILRGELHPLTMLSEDNLLDGLYSNDATDRCHSQLARYVAEMARFDPNMKLLEIGGGTASLTQPVLRGLKQSGRVLASEYMFTDISPGWFSAAQEKLADYSDAMKYQALNLEKDPASQGFEEHQYDVVLASNVVHATSNLDRSLRHIKSLLKPGGKLVLMEITKDLVWLNLVFGSLSGWWAGYEEGRTLSPLIEPSVWAAKLEQHGFTNTAPLFKDYEPEEGGIQSVFVATLKEKPQKPEPLPIDIFSSSPQDTQASDLADVLRSRLPERTVTVRDSSSSESSSGVAILLPDALSKISAGITSDSFEHFKKVLTESKAALLITSSSRASDKLDSGDWVPAFCRSLRPEFPAIRIVTLELGGPADASRFEFVPSVLESPSMDLSIAGPEVELEFSERDGQFYVPRATHLTAMTKYIYQTMGRLDTMQEKFTGGRKLIAEVETPGMIDTIRWTDDLEAPDFVEPDYIRIETRAASVNFKEVLIASGQLDGISTMLNECSGVVVEAGANMKERYSIGDRVCLVNARSFGNYPVVPGDGAVHVPEDMDFATASAVPIVWMTALQSLVHRGRLQHGEKVLIHAAAGGVGQATVMLAQHLGAEVFATCGSDAKKDVLMDHFGIPEDHIFSSRTTAFYDGIMKMTNGQGVDVVVNSLGSDLLRVSCNVLTSFGRFIEIGRRDYQEDALMPMEFLMKNITFSFIDLAQILRERPQIQQGLLQEAMDLFRTGSVRSVMQTRMPMSEITSVFRFMQSGKHIGKIILTVEPDQLVKAARPRPQIAELKPDATYIVAGGLGGLGQRIIAWLAERGARYIVCLSRSGRVDAATQKLTDELSAKDVKLTIKRCDIGSDVAVKNMLAQVQAEMPPVRGLIQSAMVLRDALFANMTEEQWSGAMSPKVLGSWNLHTHLPSDLDFFVMLSSAVALLGSMGQTNYGAGCGYQDGLAHYRQQLGLAGHSINVGAISDSGFVSENPEVAASLRRQGIGAVSVAAFLAHLDQVVAKVSFDEIPCQTSIGLLPAGTEIGLGESKWMKDRKFAQLQHQAKANGPDSAGGSDVAHALSNAQNLEEAGAIAAQAILEQLGKTIGMPPESMSTTKGLSAYGVDSLVAVEIRNWINNTLKANVSLLIIRGASSIAELGVAVVKESRLTVGSQAA